MKTDLEKMTEERDAWLFNAQQLQKQVNTVESERAIARKERDAALLREERLTQDNLELVGRVQEFEKQQRNALEILVRYLELLSRLRQLFTGRWA